MTAKEYISRPLEMNRQINDKISRLEKLRERLCSVGMTYGDEKIPGQKNVHKNEDLMIEIVDLEQEITKMIDSLVDVKAEIIAAIAQLPDGYEMMTLKLRYIEFRSWRSISEIMRVPIRTVFMYHSRALADLSVMII